MIAERRILYLQQVTDKVESSKSNSIASKEHSEEFKDCIKCEPADIVKCESIGDQKCESTDELKCESGGGEKCESGSELKCELATCESEMDKKCESTKSRLGCDYTVESKCKASIQCANCDKTDKEHCDIVEATNRRTMVDTCDIDINANNCHALFDLLRVESVLKEMLDNREFKEIDNLDRDPVQFLSQLKLHIELFKKSMELS